MVLKAIAVRWPLFCDLRGFTAFAEEVEPRR
jgi:hypothetical protein